MTSKVRKSVCHDHDNDWRKLQLKSIGQACGRAAQEFDSSTRFEKKPISVIPHADIDLGRLLGRGGFNEVLEVVAKHDGSSQEEIWAMKRLHPSCLENARSFQCGALDLVLEAKVLNSLQHKHIVQLHGVSCDDASLSTSYMGDSQYCLYMDCLYGTVNEKLDEQRRQYAPECRKQDLLIRIETIALPIAEAMKYLHANDVIYRDLKPSNMGFDAQGVVKLFDFGLAREINVKSGRLMTGATGSRRYMSPEVALSQPYGFPADVYSFGIFLFECCTLIKPFDGMSRSEHAREVTSGGNRPAFRSSCATSKSLQKLVKQCWAQSPNARPAFTRITSLLGREFETPNQVLSPNDIRKSLRRMFFPGLVHRNLAAVRESACAA